MKHSHNKNQIQKANTDEHYLINIQNQTSTKRISKSLKLLNNKSLNHLTSSGLTQNNLG